MNNTTKTGWKPYSQRRKQLPPDWQKRRRKVLARDKGLCQLRLKGCTYRATDIDHIERGNNHNLDNLRAACHHCHMVRTGHDGGTAQRHRKPAKRAPEPHPGYVKR